MGEETTGVKVRPAASIFSQDVPAIPTTRDEMLPKHLRSTTNSPLALSSVSSNTVVRVVFTFGTGSLQGEASSDIDSRMERIYRKLESGGHLAPREQKSDNRFVRAMDAVFTPEVIEFGGTAIAFSPYTAIKRKNPFCLLNPIPIAISW
jgi:hypothetical protein